MLAFSGANLASVVENAFVNKRAVDIAYRMSLERETRIKFVVAFSDIRLERTFCIDLFQAFRAEKTVVVGSVMRKSALLDSELLRGCRKAYLPRFRRSENGLNVCLHIGVITQKRDCINAV